MHKKILFAGSTDFSLPILQVLVDMQCVCAILTTPNTRKGRGYIVQKNCVADFAEAHAIPLLQPERLRSDARDVIVQYSPDILVCAAYGKIFGPRFLALFKRGAVNVHPSLLPRFRGAAPVPATILAGDVETGLTLQKISLDMDCGDILMQTRTPIKVNETTQELLLRLAHDGAHCIKDLLYDFDVIYSRATTQLHDNAVYCTKLSSAYGHITWLESAKSIVALSRAFAPPYFGAKALYVPSLQGEPRVVKLWRMTVVHNSGKKTLPGTVLGCDNTHGILIQTARGVIGVTELQLPQRKKLLWKDFIRGEKAFLTTRLL